MNVRELFISFILPDVPIDRHTAFPKDLLDDEDPEACPLAEVNLV